MFSSFKKNRIELPEFVELQTSKIRDSYFIRRATWDWLDRETINVVAVSYTHLTLPTKA